MHNIGHQKDIIIREIEYLLFENHIISESQEHKYDSNNLICITSTGIVLLDLLRNIDYLATVAEDTYFRVNERAQSIADNISGKGEVTPMSKRASLENSIQLIDYLKDYKSKHWFTPEIVIRSIDNKIETTLKECSDLINKARENDSYLIQIDELLREYPIGSEHEGVIVSIQNYGIIVQIGLNASGLAHISKFNEENKIEDFEVGEYVDVKILKIDEDKKKVTLQIINGTQHFV